MGNIRKWIFAIVIGLFLIPLLPVIVTALSNKGVRGYYKDSRCACGHDSYIHIESDGYYQYSPGHGMPEQRLFSMRPAEGGWVALGLAPKGDYWSPIEEGQVVLRLRIQGNDLYESYNGTNWTRRARIYNPWPIWFAKWLSK